MVINVMLVKIHVMLFMSDRKSKNFYYQKYCMVSSSLVSRVIGKMWIIVKFESKVIKRFP